MVMDEATASVDTQVRSPGAGEGRSAQPGEAGGGGGKQRGVFVPKSSQGNSEQGMGGDGGVTEVDIDAEAGVRIDSSLLLVSGPAGRWCGADTGRGRS